MVMIVGDECDDTQGVGPPFVQSGYGAAGAAPTCTEMARLSVPGPGPGPGPPGF